MSNIYLIKQSNIGNMQFNNHYIEKECVEIIWYNIVPLIIILLILSVKKRPIKLKEIIM